MTNSEKSDIIRRVVCHAIAHQLLTGDFLQYMGEDFQDSIPSSDFAAFRQASEEMGRILFKHSGSKVFSNLVSYPIMFEHIKGNK
jgi:hypothetical protein